MVHFRERLRPDFFTKRTTMLYLCPAARKKARTFPRGGRLREAKPSSVGRHVSLFRSKTFKKISPSLVKRRFSLLFPRSKHFEQPLTFFFSAKTTPTLLSASALR